MSMKSTEITKEIHSVKYVSPEKWNKRESKTEVLSQCDMSTDTTKELQDDTAKSPNSGNAQVSKFSLEEVKQSKGPYEAGQEECLLDGISDKKSENKSQSKDNSDGSENSIAEEDEAIEEFSALISQSGSFRPRTISAPTDLLERAIGAGRPNSNKLVKPLKPECPQVTLDAVHELKRMITPIATNLSPRGMKFDHSAFAHIVKQDKLVKTLCQMASVTNCYDIKAEEYEELSTHVYQSLSYIQSLGDLSKCEAYKKVPQPKRLTNKKMIVFDLDETLAHCTIHDDITKKRDSDIILEIKAKRCLKAGFNLRKGYRDSLREAKKYFEVVVFTASCKDYADTILNYIDPDNTLIDQRLYRESCVAQKQGVYIKDLRIFNVDLKDIILVDNAVYSFGYQLDNGIPIIPFRDDPTDDQLLKLIDYYPILAKARDSRKPLREHFRMTELYESSFEEYIKYYQEDSTNTKDELLDGLNEIMFK